jgi:hypothetical protein
VFIPAGVGGLSQDSELISAAVGQCNPISLPKGER